MQPTVSPLGPLLLLAGLVIVLVSPKKLKTLGRMLLAFVVTTVGFALLGALLRRGNPEMLGMLIGQVAVVVADGFGLFHVLSLRRAQKDRESD